MKNMKVNALANVLLKIFNIVFPLITGPYIARILSKTDYGYFNIANTFIGLFIPFATLGMYNYGIRAISKAKSKPDEINRIFSLLFYISVVSTLMTTIIYFIIAFQMNGGPLMKALYYVMAIQVFAQFLNIEWMNEAFENYTFILYKTLFIRIFMLVSIFVLVRSEHDIIQYAFLMSFVTFLNYFVSFVWIKREVKFVRVRWIEVKNVIRPLFSVLLLANAGMLYTYLDRLFLSAIALPEYVSYYTIAQMISTTISGVVGGAISVIIPRLGYYLGIGDRRSYEELVNKAGRGFMFGVIPINVGLAILGTHAMVLYAGEQYRDAGMTLVIFAIRLISWAYELVLENQIIFVQGYENKLSMFYIVGGVINLLLNSLLAVLGITDPAYYILTTMLSEIVVIVLDLLLILKNQLFDIRKITIYSGKYLGYSLGFIVISWIINNIYPVQMHVSGPFLLNILMTIVLCVVYYITILWLTKDEMFTVALLYLQEKLHLNKGESHE